ncbi:MAG: hypothetical protein N3B21_19495 [Clostridia bacterium]|nr:hypothetical protein [Clostridia bacterium]
MQILVVRLQSDSKKEAFVGHEFYHILDETEEQYEIDLALRNPFVNSKKFIPKTEIDTVKYVETFTRIDDKEYWYIDVYVFAHVANDEEQQDTVDYWKEQLQTKAMENVKTRNQVLKGLYFSIEKL